MASVHKPCNGARVDPDAAGFPELGFASAPAARAAAGSAGRELDGGRPAAGRGMASISRWGNTRARSEDDGGLAGGAAAAGFAEDNGALKAGVALLGMLPGAALGVTTGAGVIFAGAEATTGAGAGFSGAAAAIARSGPALTGTAAGFAGVVTAGAGAGLGAAALGAAALAGVSGAAALFAAAGWAGAAATLFAGAATGTEARRCCTCAGSSKRGRRKR
jgi:hypothetical protein